MLYFEYIIASVIELFPELRNCVIETRTSISQFLFCRFFHCHLIKQSIISKIVSNRSRQTTYFLSTGFQPFLLPILKIDDPL